MVHVTCDPRSVSNLTLFSRSCGNTCLNQREVPKLTDVEPRWPRAGLGTSSESDTHPGECSSAAYTHRRTAGHSRRPLSENAFENCLSRRDPSILESFTLGQDNPPFLAGYEVAPRASQIWIDVEMTA